MAKYLEMRLRTLQKRYERAPQNSAILHEICKCLITLKRDEEMLPWSRRALELNPHDVTSLTRCADALYLLGRYAEALRMWEQDPSQNTRPVLHRLRLGMNLMMAGLNRTGFFGEFLVQKLRLPDHYLHWKHNRLFRLLPAVYVLAVQVTVDC